MMNSTRRSVLELLGASAVGLAGVGTASAEGPPAKGRIRKLGHSLLSDPPGGYAESEVRSDGRYALLGSFFGEGGSFLVDIDDPTNPTEVHRVPSSSDVRNADVKFDTRDGLYYRSQEGSGDSLGVEIVDYGYDQGTPEEPEIIGKVEAGHTHNIFPHPAADIVYTVNAHGGDEHETDTGFDIFDVSDPTAPEKLGEAGRAGRLHDIVVDPERGLAHLAYIGGAFDGYVVMDVSDPTAPEELGLFSYADKPGYEEAGEIGFENCHYADYDPERELAIIGDEVGHGVPGGKHIFDIGWGDGSLERPVHLGFVATPNAQNQDESSELYDWTTHNHDVIPKGDTTLLVDGSYRDGAVVYDISDPTDPVATDQYLTDDRVEEANGPDWLGEPPMAWGANYNAERDLVVVSDMATGVYVFKVTPDASQSR